MSGMEWGCEQLTRGLELCLQAVPQKARPQQLIEALLWAHALQLPHLFRAWQHRRLARLNPVILRQSLARLHLPCHASAS